MSRRNKTKDQALVVASNTSVSDAFSNPMYRLGFGTQAPLEATEYPLTRMTDNYAKLNSMYRSGGILQSVVDIIPNDMIKEWFNLNGEISPEEHADIDRVIRKTLLREKLIDGLKWGRLYGGAAGLILIKGQENSLDQPLELDSIMPNSYKGLMIMDRWQGITPNMGLVTDMSDPDFGLPEYYEISTGDGRVMVAKVHHSRIVRFIGRKLPFLEELAEVYWGESEIEPIYDDIVLYDNIMHNMGNLTFRANLDTMEVQNLDQLFAATSTEQQKRFWNVMQAQSVAKSNFGIQLINKGDQIHNQQYAFTGFDHVTEAAQLNLSAKTHIPMTKLFGRSPAGLSSTGEGDLRNYYDIVDGERESKLRPVLEGILPIICMSAIGKVPEDLDIMFPSLWTPNATEIADIASKKTSTIINAFQAGMLNLGPAQQELKKLSDETGMFESIPDDQIESNMDVTYQDATAMADPMAGLFGGGSEQEDIQTEDSNPYPRQKGGLWGFKTGGYSEESALSDGGDGEKKYSGETFTFVNSMNIIKSSGLTKSPNPPNVYWTEKNLKEHFGSGESSDHQPDMYPGWTISQYSSFTKEIFNWIPSGDLYEAAGTHFALRYFAKTNDFVKVRIEKDGYSVITMFKPDTGYNYFLSEASTLT